MTQSDKQDISSEPTLKANGQTHDLLSIIDDFEPALDEYERCVAICSEAESPPHPLEKRKVDEAVSRGGFLQIQFNVWMKKLALSMRKHGIDQPPLLALHRSLAGHDPFLDNLKRLPKIHAALVSLRAAIENEKTAAPPSPETNWRDVQRRLMGLYERPKPYTSIGDLAKQLQCSVSTIQKAIKLPQSALKKLSDDDRKQAVARGKKLAGWQARHLEKKKTPSAISMNNVVESKAVQSSEPNPAEEAEANDMEAVFDRLIQDAPPEVRAALNALKSEDVRNMTHDQLREVVEDVRKMTPDQRKEIVRLLGENPDDYDRVLGRKP